jgi:polyisoprenoid-binding protein YceI
MVSPRRLPLRKAVLAGGAVLVLFVASLATAAYSFLKPTAAPNGTVSAVPLATQSGGSTYQIQPTDSRARFVINEVLRGSPKTVVGTTNQVAGEIAFDASQPTSAQLGTILVNARGLTTDDPQRTRALANQILKTDQYEYISFSPTRLSGLPQTVSAGQPFTFQAAGNLTIRGVTRPVQFDVTVTPDTDGSISGLASTSINYADWGLSIPNVPFVASVDNQVVLQLEFDAESRA